MIEFYGVYLWFFGDYEFGLWFGELDELVSYWIVFLGGFAADYVYLWLVMHVELAIDEFGVIRGEKKPILGVMGE